MTTLPAASDGVIADDLPVGLPDGTTTTASVYYRGDDAADAAGDAGAAGARGYEERPLVVLWPGFGMEARYYRPLCQELAARGYAVAVGELRGQGRSSARATKEHRWGYHHLASQDYPLTIEAAKEHLGLARDHATVLLCHSMGGQIASLFVARSEAAELGVIGVMSVGAGSPFYKGFTGRNYYRLRWGTPLMLGTAKVLGYVPEGRYDFAGYGRQSVMHIQEWVRFGHTNRLDNLHDEDIDYVAAKQEATIPFLLTFMGNDDDCPVASAENLASALPKAALPVEELPGNLGHNRWAREPQVVADRLDRFVAELSH